MTSTNYRNTTILATCTTDMYEVAQLAYEQEFYNDVFERNVGDMVEYQFYHGTELDYETMCIARASIHSFSFASQAMIDAIALQQSNGIDTQHVAGYLLSQGEIDLLDFSDDIIQYASDYDFYLYSLTADYSDSQETRFDLEETQFLDPWYHPNYDDMSDCSEF